ncbi:uncharacterized protein BCR38DRAFT_11661 [Pseudomassariella vexata]|uniref:Uncharacterized protein n=1 Tax=Pseudomassariella vexata TaxID=1141098 RepID=A0A1Y2EIZ9_9PEZI|nr:uncharacterized protein BCR38DRAFT_11661 [Pseudomassariella vexata]ORY71520.1 hypothetical protein BCR38DRAFT_11661 [Pseudomassariella vexata]
MSGFSQSHSIFTRNGGKKADVLGLKDHKPQSETLYSLGQDRQQDLDPAASKTPTIETNQSSAPMNLPHHSRHPALCLFTVAWILFFVFFLLPWQLLNDRPGWNLTRSISHDFTHCKEALNSFVKAPATTTTTIYVPAPIPTHVPNTESEVKMTTEQT